MGRDGRINTALAGKEILDAYYWDKMEAAHEGVLAVGTGQTAEGAIFFRQVEGEYLTRRSATTIELAPWLRIEFRADEVDCPESTQTLIVDACHEVATRLGYEVGPPVLITVLTIESDAFWAVGRFGYFVDKYPYDKICVPTRDMSDSQRLRSTVMHEFAHAVVLNLAEGRAPRWMNEMVAMIMQGDPDPNMLKSFGRGQIPWLSPTNLSVNYLADRQGAGGEIVHRAYAQSACIGSYIVDQFGEQSLANLLRAFSDNGLIKELAMRAASINPADEAIKQTYGLTESRLFEAAHDWVLKRA